MPNIDLRAAGNSLADVFAVPVWHHSYLSVAKAQALPSARLLCLRGQEVSLEVHNEFILWLPSVNPPSIFGNEYQTGNSICLGERMSSSTSACPWAGGGLDLALGEALSELC